MFAILAKRSMQERKTIGLTFKKEKGLIYNNTPLTLHDDTNLRLRHY